MPLNLRSLGYTFHFCFTHNIFQKIFEFHTLGLLFGFEHGMGKLLLQPSSLEEVVYSGQVSISPVEIIQELIENSIDAGSTNVSIQSAPHI